jgi:elongation factor Ts
MTQISANAVKELREKTGAGMMDCKKALIETSGAFEAAVDWLRKKGLSAANKKSDRVAAEGLICCLVKDKKGIVLELNSETDFVAKNDKFQSLARNLTESAFGFSGDVEQFKSHKLVNGKAVSEEIIEHIAVIGENMNLRRMQALSVESGAVVSYVHNSAGEGLGKIGVLVALESAASSDKLQQIGKSIAMHIAAAKPESLNVSDLDASKIERERQIFSEQAAASGKPADVIAKMVEGRIRKYYEEVVLMEQVYMLDGKTKISALVEQAAAQAGSPIKVTGYVRYALGEGIEKPQE